MDVNLTVKSKLPPTPIEKAQDALNLFKDKCPLYAPRNPQLMKKFAALVISLKKCPAHIVVEHLVVPLVNEFFGDVRDHQTELSERRKKSYTINSGIALMEVARESQILLALIEEDRENLLPTKGLNYGLTAQFKKLDYALKMELSNNPNHSKSLIVATDTAQALNNGGGEVSDTYRQDNKQMLETLARKTQFYTFQKQKDLFLKNKKNNSRIASLQKLLNGLKWMNNDKLPTEVLYLKSLKHLCTNPTALKILLLAIYNLGWFNRTDEDIDPACLRRVRANIVLSP